MNGVVFSGQASVIVTFLASFLIWLMYGAFLAFWLFGKRITKKQALQVFLASLFAWVFAELIKYAFPTTRPFIANGLSPMTLTVPTDPAFPSTHSAVAFGMATSVWFHHKKMGYLLLLSALLVGLGRVWANVHYPGDILGGAVLGSVGTLILRFVMLV